MNQKKATISLVLLGHIDHGKSTTLGRFLYESGVVDERMIEKLREESKAYSMESWTWAYVLDTLPEERQKGITADIAFQYFETDRYKFVLIDAPGHRDFVKNALRGAAQADAALLVVSAVENDLKAGLKAGTPESPGGQTREHAILGSVLGIEQLIVCINKMDLVNYSQKSYELAVKAMKHLFKIIQSPWLNKIEQIPFIPISGLHGDNLVKKSENMPWYDGPTLLEGLNSLSPPKSKENMPLRFVADDAYDRPGSGTVLQGKIISGRLKINDKVKLLPAGEMGTVKEIWLDEDSVPEAISGEHVVVNLRDVNRDNLDAGVVLAPPNYEYQPPKEITARLLVMEKPLIPASTLALHCGTSHTSAQVSEILSIERKSSAHSKVPRENMGRIMIAFPSELITAKITVLDPIVIEKYDEFPELGRIILRHMGQTVGVGIVTELTRGK